LDNLSLQPIDLLVAAKVAAHPQAQPSVRQLGEELGMSKSAVAYSLRRLGELGLVEEGEGKRRRVNKIALCDCLEHAVRWIAPAKVGEYELGLPTAHTAGVLAAKFVGDDDSVVMPLAHGPARGRAVTPLHPLAPPAAARDPKLYDLLALIDAFRVGRARDRHAAAVELRARL
jgi:DNA-binding transcriptional ArsR family regulator